MTTRPNIPPHACSALARRCAVAQVPWLALLLALGVWSCSNQGAEMRADELARSIRENQVEHFVRTFAVAAPQRAVARAEADAHRPSIRALIEEGRLGFEPDAQVREMVTLLFAEREYEHLFVFGTQLTPDGEAVVRTLLGADRHGLSPDDYYAAEIRVHAAGLAAGGDLGPIVGRLQLTTEDEARLLAFLLDKSGLDSSMPASDAAFEVIAIDGWENPLPGFADTLSELTRILEHVATSGPELELVLAAGYLRYAADQRLSSFHDIPTETLVERSWDPDDDEQRDEILRARLTESFRRATDSVGFAAEIENLEPPFQQYDRLVAGIEEYRGYVDAGGWDTLELDRSLSEGRRGDDVLALRRRLAAENYFDGDVENDRFDAELNAAVENYQTTHQLEVDGEVTGGTLRSLNVPADRRLAQIIVTLVRWRQSRAAADWQGDYIFVNVADFHAELWDGPERVYRWRVIVGRERGRGPNGEIRGRTPLFSDRLQYLVFNPYWNVPETIQREEYDPLIAADPNWLADNGFEFHYSSGGNEMLRQLPGPGNSLGIVKFLFPNAHDVYMHDTPSRSLFRRAVRSYSHGCVRVDDPLDLANLLLRRDRDWSEWRSRRFIERRLAPGTEEWVSLIDPIPIHIEYYTVRGDDDGRMNFLADPYRYDVEQIDATVATLNGDPEAVAGDDEAVAGDDEAVAGDDEATAP